MNYFRNSVSGPEVIDLISSSSCEDVFMSSSSAALTEEGSEYVGSVGTHARSLGRPVRVTRGGLPSSFLSPPGSVFQHEMGSQMSEVELDDALSEDQLEEEPNVTLSGREIPVPLPVEELPEVIAFARHPIIKPLPYDDLVRDLQTETDMVE